MGNNACSSIVASNEDEICHQQTQIFDEYLQSPSQKQSHILHSPLQTKFLSFRKSHVSLLSLSTQSLPMSKKRISLQINDQFKLETGRTSTQSVYVEDSDEDSEFFIVQNQMSDSLAVDLLPYLNNFQPLRKKIQKYVKHQEIDINQIYQLQKVLKKGRERTIFLAKHKITEKRRAIKAIISGVENKLKKVVKVVQQTQILSKLDHPSIIKVVEISHFENKNYIIMQLCQGPSLQSVINELVIMKVSKKQKINIYMKICKQILKALIYMHEKKVVYRNIRKSNILLFNKEIIPVENNIVKLINFSKAYEIEHQSVKTKLSNIDIASPEELNEKISTFKTDIWHLGTLMFELLTQNKPFFKEFDEDKNVHVFIKNTQGWKFLPQKYEYLLKKMLQIQEKQRYSSKQCIDDQVFQSDELPEYFNKSRKIKTIIKKKLQQRRSNLFNHIQALAVFKNIAKEQLKELTSLFQSLDTDNNGIVQLNQVLLIMETQSKKNGNSLQQAIQIIKTMDIDGSGSIDYHEFLTGLCGKQQIFKQPIIQDIFKHFDRDGNGIIDEEQFKKEMQGVTTTQFEYYLDKLGIKDVRHLTKSQFMEYTLKRYHQYYENQADSSK